MNPIEPTRRVSPGPQPASGNEAAFAIIRQLAERASDLLLLDDERAADCLAYVSDTYRSTRSEVLRQAIETCFVHHIGARISGRADRSALLNRLPRNLQELLLRQMRISSS